jgi:hypothetical protein
MFNNGVGEYIGATARTLFINVEGGTNPGVRKVWVCRPFLTKKERNLCGPTLFLFTISFHFLPDFLDR